MLPRRSGALGQGGQQSRAHGTIDAAVTLVSTLTETATAERSAPGDSATGTVRRDQFYRYSSDGQMFADEGYPLRIQNNLRREPHFAHLEAPAERGVDGVWADTGNVFVFISDRLYVASVGPVRRLDGVGIDGPRAADVEEGRLTVCGSGGWRHIRPPEAHVRAALPALPSPAPCPHRSRDAVGDPARPRQNGTVQR
jgi:hypothetical protein